MGMHACRFGGPVWWNTPLDDEDAQKAEENRTTWGQGQDAGGSGSGAGPSSGGRKRPADDLEDDDELPDEVRVRLEALKRGGGGKLD